MINFKKTLNTFDIILSIKNDVDNAILDYNNCNSEWKTYVRMAYYQFRTVGLVAMTGDYLSAFEELMQETDFRKLYKYKEIRDYIFKITNVE